MKFKKLFMITMIFMLVGSLLAACSSSNTTSENNSGNDSNGDAKPSEPKEQSAFYDGKMLELIVPYGAGGGTDTFARYIAPFMSKYTPGKPDVQTINIPGGGSINGSNEFVMVRKHDGLTALVTSASTHAPYLLGEKAVKYDLKKMVPVVGLPTGGVVYTSPSTGIESPSDLLDSKEKLVYAGISATGLDLVTLLSYEVLGLDVQAVLGYDGRGPSRVAFEQGESNIDYQTSSAYLTNVQPLVDEGKAIPMYSFGQLNSDGDIVRDPAFPDLPSLKEVYEELYGKEPSGNAWEAYKTFVGSSFTVQKVIWLHSDAPPEAAEALKQGAIELVKDQEFKEKGTEVLGNYEPYTGDDVDNVVKGMLNVSDDVLDWVKQFLEEKYGIERLK